MSDSNTKPIRVLAICASPRQGNSSYLLQKSLEVCPELSIPTEVEVYSFRGKTFNHCTACMHCFKTGDCIFKDDFAELRQKWIQADVVIYATPVYHLSIPSKLKAFLDRLGNTFYGYYQVPSTRHLKVIGTLATGMHFFGGQELAINTIIDHAVLLNCLPVSGDGWQSYMGAAAWTDNNENRGRFEELAESDDRDAQISIQAGRSTVKRCVETAAIVCRGLECMEPLLKSDPRFQFSIARAKGDRVGVCGPKGILDFSKKE